VKTRWLSDEVLSYTDENRIAHNLFARLLRAVLMTLNKLTGIAGSKLADLSENYEARADYQVAFFFYSFAALLLFLFLAAAILFIMQKIVSIKSRN